MAYFPGLGPSYLPLFKIPLVITSSALGAVAMTPPRPPVATTDRKKYGERADPLGSLFVRRFAVPMYKGIYWTNAIAETLAILCTHFPSPVGDTILSLITRQPETAGNIRFTRIWLAGAVMLTTGSLIRFACFQTLGRFFTWEMSLQRDQHLVTSGPYSIVRHPSYTGSWLLSIGTILMHLGPGGWLYECVGGGEISNGLMAAWGIWHVAVPILLTMRVSREDEVLRKEFGAEWETYARRTPYRLVPYLY